MPAPDTFVSTFLQVRGFYKYRVPKGTQMYLSKSGGHKGSHPLRSFVFLRVPSWLGFVRTRLLPTPQPSA
jgi:hypothetical protein